MATTYITPSHLYEAFSQEAVEGVVQDVGVSLLTFLASLNAEIDAYVGAAVPLPPSSAAIDVVRSAVADLAWFRLNRDAASPLIRTRAEDALAFLKMIAERKLALPGPEDDPSTPEDESASLAADFGAAPRRMSRQQLKGW